MMFSMLPIDTFVCYYSILFYSSTLQKKLLSTMFSAQVRHVQAVSDIRRLQRPLRAQVSYQSQVCPPPNYSVTRIP